MLRSARVTEHDHPVGADSALERLAGRLNLPSFLDPWWHLDFEATTGLPVEVARSALTQTKGYLRGRRLADGSLIVYRRRGLMNEFVRGHAWLIATESGTTVRTRIARSQATSSSMTSSLLLFLTAPLAMAIVMSVVHGLSTGISWLPLEVIAPALWVMVVAMNYTSVRSEAKDLRRLIFEALSPGAYSTAEQDASDPAH
jgi:hypothetical protein